MRETALSTVSRRVSGTLIHRKNKPRRRVVMRRSVQGSLVQTVRVNPFRCRVWDLHDRLEECVTEGTCKAEIESFMAHGQRVPTLGRPLHGDPDHDVELIYGTRRLFVARHLNMPLLVELREVSDMEAILAIDIENRQRLDVSPYERALSYSRWLAAGYFSSQDALAREFKISPAQVSRLLRLAKLPAVVVNAFATPLDLREEWGLSLGEALSDDRARDAIIRQARSIAAFEPRPIAREVFRALLAAAARGPKVRAKPRDDVVRDDDGRPLFRIRRQPKAIALLLPPEHVSARCLEEIQAAVSRIMKAHRRRGLRPRTESIDAGLPCDLNSRGNTDRLATARALEREASTGAG